MPHKDPEVRRAYMRDYHASHREAAAQRQREWRDEHRDQWLATRRAWYAAHREQRAAQEASPQRRDARREWDAVNPRLSLGNGHIVRVRHLPIEWQPVALAVLEARRLLRSSAAKDKA